MPGATSGRCFRNGIDTSSHARKCGNTCSDVVDVPLLCSESSQLYCLLTARKRSLRRHGVASAGNKRWSLYGAPWLQPVAISGKSDRRGSRKNKPKPLPWVATGCPQKYMVRRASTVRVRQRALAKAPQKRGFHLLRSLESVQCARVRNTFWNTQTIKGAILSSCLATSGPIGDLLNRTSPTRGSLQSPLTDIEPPTTPILFSTAGRLSLEPGQPQAEAEANQRIRLRQRSCSLRESL
jgi:hypothetical protein